MLSIASIVYSFSISPSYDFDYAVTLDTWVNPLAVQQPTQFPWRAQSGVLQRQNGFGTWENYTGTMNQFFNDYGVATTADILSSTELNQVIMGPSGTYSYTRLFNGLQAPLTTTFYNIAPLLGQIGTELSEIFVSSPNLPFLSADGSSTTIPYYVSLGNINRLGFLGLSSNLSRVSSQLVGASGFQFMVGLSGTSQSVSSLLGGVALLNNNLNQWINSTGQGNILYQDGTVLEVNGANLEQILRYGFLGLGTMIGSSSLPNGVPMTFIDYQTGQPESSQIFSTSLFELNAAGFEGIQNLLALYLFSHGTDLDIKERENMQEQANTFVDEFTDPNGNGTPSTGNIKDTAGVSSGIKDAFSSSATASDAFNQLTSDENYSFFSSEVQNSLNPFYSAQSYSRSEDDFTDYVHPKLDEIFGGLGSSW